MPLHRLERTKAHDDVGGADEIAQETQAIPKPTNDNIAELVHQVLAPLYERFNFFGLPTILIEAELAKMTKGRF